MAHQAGRLVNHPRALTVSELPKARVSRQVAFKKMNSGNQTQVSCLQGMYVTNRDICSAHNG